MKTEPASVTRVTLLMQLRRNPSDADAWRDFVHHYRPRVLNWCSRWGAQASDAEDISQMVLLKLSQKLGDFEYDPSRSFRGWLRTIAHHAWHDFRKHQKWPGRRATDGSYVDILENIEARDDLMKQLDEECSLQILHEAMCRVQERVAATTWEAFCLTAINGLSGREVAEKLGIAASTVLVHKFRVQKLLEEEAKRIDTGYGPEHRC